MAQHSLLLSEELDRFIAKEVESGHFVDASEVIEHAVRRLALGERIEEQELMALRQAIEEGDASGVYEGDVFADLRGKYGLPARA